MPESPLTQSYLQRKAQDVAAQQDQADAWNPSYASDSAAASAAPAPEAKWPYWMIAAGQGADAASTLAAVHSGRFAEGNPLGLGGTMAAKAGATALAMYLAHRAHQAGNDRAQKAIGVIGGLSGFIPAGWNLSQMAR